MKDRIHFLPLSTMMLAITIAPLRAQVPDGSSNTYINATNAFANVTIGTNGSFTLLTLGNNALFTNSGNGVIGLNATAKSNEVRLISPTARWLMNGTLHVGSNGAANRLVVSNGATVRNNGVGYLGVGVSSSNNIALITGPGSLWTNGNSLILGDNGMGNQLVISNGGVVRAASAFVSAGLSSSNLMTVTGPGSAWNSSGDFRFGYSGAGNLLIISNGGLVQNANGTLGSNPTGRNNQAVVTGSGSTWNNQLNLIVGLDGAGNQLVVSNAGTVVNQTGYIGGGATSSSNSVVVVGTNSLWNLSQSLAVGSSSQNNQLVVSNGGVVVNTVGTIGQNIPSSNNTVTISGTGSLWNNTSTLNLGASGGGNRMLVSGGAVARNGLAYVGLNSSSSNNLATVSGAGSVWSNAFELYLGYGGRGNQLVVSNGGVARDSLTYVGFNATSSSNLVLVTDTGSVWSNAFELYLGLNGAGNQLVVSNGGVVQSSIGYVGAGNSGSNNLAVVTGPGSMWSNTYEFYFGSSAGNRLVVSDGGALLNTRGNVGYSASSSNNVALVTGAGSWWTNSLTLTIGNSGSRNQLIVSNGATVFSGGVGFIGYDTGATANSATVTDPGTRWLLSSNLYVGSNGALSRLVITNGARVGNANGTLGGNASSSNNLAVVTGAGSVWSNTSDLLVGFGGAGNQLVVSNGGVVWNNTGELGYSSSSNLAIVTGAGSVWGSTINLLIGRSGSFNQLVVSNGGAVLNENTYAHFSVSSSAGSNTAVVTGPNSKWIVFGFTLGESGPGNRLVVTNGGLVQSFYTYMGFDSSGRSTNNAVLVTGSGSVWSNAADFYVGYFGAGNQLLISNGGVLSGNGGVYLGISPSSTNNRVEISGGALVASNAFGNALLDVRRGTNVLTAGLVDVGRLLITNILGFFEFNSGTLVTSGTTNNNGRVFAVGNGTSAANFELRGGTHSFANNLSIANNGSLTGNGTVLGTVNVLPGGTLSPGTSIGKLTLSNSPVLQGATIMEISRNGSVLTTDQIQVAGLLAYGGSLSVTNIGPTLLVAGDRFQLFSAATYAGAFSTLTLPPLGGGLVWTNKLLVDGSIEVLGGFIPKFTSISQVGTNLVLTGTGGISNASYTVLTATNAAQPLTEWTSITTNQFGMGGSFSFTNGINPGTSQRYYRLRWP